MQSTLASIDALRGTFSVKALSPKTSPGPISLNTLPSSSIFFFNFYSNYSSYVNYYYLIDFLGFINDYLDILLVRRAMCNFYLVLIDSLLLYIS